MTTPSVDIIIPVWNHPFETRACLVSILTTTDDNARLIIINNGCNRDTELLLEEFCDPLGERVLYMTMERNIGFVPAVNRGLARSTADWAMIVRPNGTLGEGCLQKLLQLTANEQAGIISPLCTTETPLPNHLSSTCCSHLETCQLSFAGLLLSRTMRDEIGGLDESLDGGVWCLRDYQQRSASRGYRTFLVPGAVVHSGPAMIYGSLERRREREQLSQHICHSRWGTPRRYAVYFPKQTDSALLNDALAAILVRARHGDRFTLFLHHRQFRLASQLGYRCLHTAVELVCLARIGAIRDLRNRLARLVALDPLVSVVKGVDGMPVPGYDGALPFTVIEQQIPESTHA